MEYVKFGSTGLEVSKLVLGCMTFGEPLRGTHPWTLPEAESRPIIQRAVEAGINFFDTANMYSDGTSEEIVGRALRDFTKRDDVVIATKVFYRMRPGPNGAGLSRKAIMTDIDQSLKRLGTDYVDLYQIHRWDYGTPIEETLEALHDIVKAGKARYIGASSMFAWQFAKALYTSKQNGWTRFVSMQNHLNLLYREEEREMLPLCEAEGDQSLKRLGTDYVDLYQIHRWDYGTPIEETFEALHDVVKAGKARYIGASSMFAWQFAKALHTSTQNGWTRFVSMQNHVNLLYREEEREMLPLCEAEGIAVIPWSPLARGRLTRNWDESSGRQQSDDVGQRLYDATADADRAIVEAVAAIAAARNVPRAQVALAWVAHKRGITAPIVGISKPHHLDDALGALELKLTDDEIAALEGPYVPHAVAGFN